MVLAIILISILGIGALACGVMYFVRRADLDYSWENEHHPRIFYYGLAFWVLGVVWLFAFISTLGFAMSEENVSGIVYNTKNNAAISGNTYFSIRAAVDTYVSNENQSSFCLPPNSPYKELVNQAASDKNIKVVVTTKKYFKFKAPWTCVDNITVTRPN